MNFYLFSIESPAAAALSVTLIAYGVAVIAMTLASLVKTTRRKDPLIADAADGNGAVAPGVSVVIPFRNEEQNLNALLASIDKQNYKGMIEIILVNDMSTDGGADVIKKFIPRNKNLCINMIDLHQVIDTDIGTNISTNINTNINTDTRLTSKQKALDIGVDKSSHRLILFTDADMILEPTWVESMVNSHLSIGADMVFGHTAINGLLRRFATCNDRHCERSEAIQNNLSALMNTDCYSPTIIHEEHINVSNDTDNTVKRGFIDKLLILLESYQLEYLFSFAYAFSKINLTGSCMGNNILITKEAYAACGGQRGVGYTIVEDRALLELVRKRGFKTIAQEPFTVTAWTYPSRSPKQFVNQMLRWARGGLRPGGGLFVAGLLLLAQNIIFLLSMTCILPPVLMLQSVANFILTWAFLSISFCKNGSPVSKILFPAYYIFMMAETALFLPLMLLGRGIEWKDRRI